MIIRLAFKTSSGPGNVLSYFALCPSDVDILWQLAGIEGDNVHMAGSDPSSLGFVDITGFEGLQFLQYMLIGVPMAISIEDCSPALVERFVRFYCYRVVE